MSIHSLPMNITTWVTNHRYLGHDHILARRLAKEKLRLFKRDFSLGRTKDGSVTVCSRLAKFSITFYYTEPSKSTDTGRHTLWLHWRHTIHQSHETI